MHTYLHAYAYIHTCINSFFKVSIRRETTSVSCKHIHAYISTRIYIHKYMYKFVLQGINPERDNKREWEEHNQKWTSKMERM